MQGQLYTYSEDKNSYYAVSGWTCAPTHMHTYTDTKSVLTRLFQKGSRSMGNVMVRASLICMLAISISLQSFLFDGATLSEPNNYLDTHIACQMKNLHSKEELWHTQRIHKTPKYKHARPHRGDKQEIIADLLLQCSLHSTCWFMISDPYIYVHACVFMCTVWQMCVLV